MADPEIAIGLLYTANKNLVKLSIAIPTTSVGYLKVWATKCLSLDLANTEQSNWKCWDVSTSSATIQLLQLDFGKIFYSMDADRALSLEVHQVCTCIYLRSGKIHRQLILCFKIDLSRVNLFCHGDLLKICRQKRFPEDRSGEYDGCVSKWLDCLKIGLSRGDFFQRSFSLSLKAAKILGGQI